MKVDGRPKVNLSIGLELNEEEARALAGLSEFDTGQVLEIISSKISDDLVKKYGNGLRSILIQSSSAIKPWLKRLDRARNSFNEERMMQSEM
jgi:hypothetical protein